MSGLFRRANFASVVLVLGFFLFLCYLNTNGANSAGHENSDGTVKREKENTFDNESPTPGDPETNRIVNERQIIQNVLKQSDLDFQIISNEHERIHEELEVAENEKFELLYSSKIKQLDKPKILILSACDSNCDVDLVNKSIQNRESYASRYENIIHHYIDLEQYKDGPDSSTPTAWLKIPAIQDTFKNFPHVDWIWWLDIDALIMNKEISISRDILSRQVIETCLMWDHPLRNTDAKFHGHRYHSRKDGGLKSQNLDLIITQDRMGINAGSFMIRRSTFSNILLDFWNAIDERDHWNRHEQDGLIHLLLTYKSLLSHVALVPQRLFNAYHDDTKSHIWRYKPGDFVVHLAGWGTSQNFKSIYNSYYNEL